MNPEIIFEDKHLAVLSKPAGLLSQGGNTGDENLVDWLRVYFGREYVGLIHRLDRNTSGLMVVAKRTKAARRLSEALRENQLERHYLAWVLGKFPKKAEWSHWLLKDTARNKVSVFKQKKKNAKEALLKAKAVHSGQWHGQKVTLAEFILKTGRSHQIRVQAAHEGYPLLGDMKYGAGAQGEVHFARPALHSASIRFPHPMSNEILGFEAPLPPDMKKPMRI